MTPAKRWWLVFVKVQGIAFGVHVTARGRAKAEAKARRALRVNLDRNGEQHLRLGEAEAVWLEPRPGRGFRWW